MIFTVQVLVKCRSLKEWNITHMNIISLFVDCSLENFYKGFIQTSMKH